MHCKCCVEFLWIEKLNEFATENTGRNASSQISLQAKIQIQVSADIDVITFNQLLYFHLIISILNFTNKVFFFFNSVV